MSVTPFYHPGLPMRVAISLDGSGSNARKIIEYHIAERDAGKPSYEPVMLLTGTPSSNAVKISTEYSSKGVALPVFVNSFRDFFKARGRDTIKEEKEMPIRSQYDTMTVQLLSAFGVDCVALAGDEYVKSPVLSNTVLTVNVHPGDLRVKYDSGKSKGKPKYTGLGWIPSAKAILAGETEVFTSVHIVTPELDGGPVLAVSGSQQVPKEVLSLEDRAILLGNAKSIQEIADFMKEHPAVQQYELAQLFPLYKHSVDCQERLKVNGDWVVFPRTIRDIALGRYGLDDLSQLYFENKPTGQWLKR